MNRRTLAHVVLFALVVFTIVPFVSGEDSFEMGNTSARKVEGIGRLLHAVQTPQGYISLHESPNGNAFVRTVSLSGKKLWEKELAFGSSLTSVAPISDGYVFQGYQSGYYYYGPFGTDLVAINYDGTVRWTRRFESFATSVVFSSVKSRDDGGFFMIGRMSQPTATVVTSFTSNGDAAWSRSYGKLPFSDSVAVADGLILGSRDGKILKIDNFGNVIWSKSFRSKGQNLWLLGAAPGNGVILTGTLGHSQLLLAKLNSEGNLEWTAAYWLNVPHFDPSGITATDDGGFTIAGTRSRPANGILIKIDSKQDVVFRTGFRTTGTPVYGQFVFGTTTNESIVFASNGAQLQDLLLLKVNPKRTLPGCGLFYSFKASRLKAPEVSSTVLEVTGLPFYVPSPTGISPRFYSSDHPSVDACP